MFGHENRWWRKLKKKFLILCDEWLLWVSVGDRWPGDGWCLPNSSALLVIPFSHKHTVTISYHMYICKIKNMTICVYFLIHGTYHLMGVDLIPWPEWLCKPVYLSTCLTHWAKHTVQSKQPWMVASTGRRPGLQRQFQKAIGFGKLISWRVLQGDISWWKWKGRVGVGGDIRKLITSAK